jgi:hypothetical protein
VPQATRNDNTKQKARKEMEKKKEKKTTTMQMRLQNVAMHNAHQTQMTNFFLMSPP